MVTGDTAVEIAADGAAGAGASGSAATLIVNEIFGPTVQGEGPAAGRNCLFVRLALCNLRCRWCDTPYTWAFTQNLAAHLDRPQVYDQADNARRMTVAEVLDQLRQRWDIEANPTTVVISGGEPLLQQRALAELTKRLIIADCQVHVETAGTIAPQAEFRWTVHQFVVSPKLAHSGNPLDKRIRPDVLAEFRDMGRQAVFKFVVTGMADLDEVDQICRDAAIAPSQVMVMPEGTTAPQVLSVGAEVADAAAERGWGVSLRSHILLWSDVRGK
jgi:7-carboxy-7-deazaguanine synthase